MDDKSPEEHLTGLNNLGNTCYANATLQALFASIELRNYLIDRKWDSTFHSSVSELFKELKTSNESISPEEFIKTLTTNKTQFCRGEQHDAHEFLMELINGIHEEENKAKNRKMETRVEPKSPKESWIQYIKYMDDSFLVKLFVGQLSSTIKCTKCLHESKCWDTFWDISLAFPEEDKDCYITDCLETFTSDEVLDDDSMPNCSRCKLKTKSIKTLSIIRFPLILIIQLKRFDNNGHKISKKIFFQPFVVLKSVSYQLFACICHKGGYSSSGHYYTYCRYDYNKRWYLFDDESAQQVTDAESYLPYEAYILLYHKNGITIKY